MAIKKNQEKTKKSKKPLLIIGLILLFAALFVGVGFLITSSIVFARNAIALMLLGGAGVGIATPVVKGINSLINKDSKKEQTQTRERTRDRNRDQNLEDIPEQNEELDDDEELSVDMDRVNAQSSRKTTQSGSRR